MPERVCSTVGVFPTLVPWKGSVEGRGGCPTSKVAGTCGSDLCRTNDPGHQVSPAPLLCLAVFIHKCTWLPSLRDQGLQGMTGPFQFLQVVIVFRARQAAKGRLAVTIFSGDTWHLGSVWQYTFLFLGPISAVSLLLSEHKAEPQEWDRVFSRQLESGEYQCTQLRVGETRAGLRQRVFYAEICSHLKKHIC